MARKAENFTGMRFGHLTVIERGENYYCKGRAYPRWRCKCDCGNETLVIAAVLKAGKKKSCGCDYVNPGKKYNKFEIMDDGSAKVYFFNCDDFFLCDSDDWDRLKKYCWSKDNRGYAEARVNGKTTLFHHLVLDECPEKLVRDHINRNKLDNRKKNLRIVTPSENIHNKLYKNKYGYRGIYTYKSKGKIRYQVSEGKRKRTKCFKELKDAIEYSKKVHGELSKCQGQ